MGHYMEIKIDPSELSRLAIVDTKHKELGELLPQLLKSFIELQFCVKNKRKNECGIIEEKCYHMIVDACEKSKPVPKPNLTGLKQI